MKQLVILVCFFATLTAYTQEAKDYLKQANEALSNNESTYRVIKTLDKALKLDPNNQEALYLKAKTLNEAKRYTESLNALNTLISLNNTTAKYYYVRAETLAEHGQRNYEFETGVLKAQKDLDKMLALKNTADGHYRKGILYELLAKDLERTDTNKNKASKYYNLARQYYSSALDLQPDHKALEKIRILKSKS